VKGQKGGGVREWAEENGTRKPTPGDGQRLNRSADKKQQGKREKMEKNTDQGTASGKTENKQEQRERKGEGTEKNEEGGGNNIFKTWEKKKAGPGQGEDKRGGPTKGGCKTTVNEKEK